MQRLIAPEDMRRCEKQYFETSGIPSIDIMENAAKALAHAAMFRFPDAKRICIACGPGGNGGDGYACARLLHEAGKMCVVFAPAPAKSPDAVQNARRAAESGVAIMDVERLEGMPRPDLWIDCLYGTGLSRTPDGPSAEIIQRINFDRFRGCGVIACDIPSGLNGRTGKAYDPCVQANITVTFQLPKYGHYLQDGLDMCGETITADVGFPEEIFPEKLPELFEPSDLHTLFLPRRRNIHKGSCGHLLVIAGSVGMAGAAALCAKAALRSGAGLVTIACPEEIVPILQIHAPCAMCIPLPQTGGAISAGALPLIREALSGKSAVAIGPGLSRRVPPEIIRAVLESGLPAAIDADALNIIAENPELKSLLKPHHVLTPHPGEAARLLGRKVEDPIADAQELAHCGPTVLLKGASRVICTGSFTGFSEEVPHNGTMHEISPGKARFISTSGCSGMARGGSGDVLTGILGALLGRLPTEPSPGCIADTSAAACEIHGLAGEAAAEKYGLCAMNSADIIEFLPEVFKAHAD